MLGSSEYICSQLMAKTVYHIDRGNIEDFVRLFDVDGILEVRGQVHRGHEAIRALLGGRDPSRVPRHMLCTPTIFIEGEEGRGVGYFTVYEGHGDADSVLPLGQPVSVGEFHQRYRLGPNGWSIIAHRSQRIFQPTGAGQ